MHITWADPKLSPYTDGSLYVGEDHRTKALVGCKTEKHALTIASARSGKGVGTIIQNLLRWPESALVIDPKGEAAEATAEHRESMGQAVHVLDPFKACIVPDRFYARFNPLDEIDLQDNTARQDISVLADSIIMRHSESAGHWDGGGETVVAGMIAHILKTSPDEHRHLGSIRTMLRLKDENFGYLVEDMRKDGSAGGLPQDAAAKLLAQKEAIHFRSVADSNTEWLGDDAIQGVMRDSTFRLSDLKSKPTTIFLVLPPALLKANSRFLRLFVLCAINAMGKGRPSEGHKCLFLLDEFFSLGYLDKVASSSGLMPGYGVHLWPILQDFGQLVKLYDMNGAQTFLENSDLLQFFGASGKTAEIVSELLGRVGVHDVDEPPEIETGWETFFRILTSGLDSQVGDADKNNHWWMEAREHRYQREMNEYQHQARKVGAPRVTPEEVANLTAKRDGVVADAQIAIIKERAFLLGVKPYFEDDSLEAPKISKTQTQIKRNVSNSRQPAEPVVKDNYYYNRMERLPLEEIPTEDLKELQWRANGVSKPLHTFNDLIEEEIRRDRIRRAEEELEDAQFDLKKALKKEQDFARLGAHGVGNVPDHEQWVRKLERYLKRMNDKSVDTSNLKYPTR